MADPLLPGHVLLLAVVGVILLLAAAALYWAWRTGQLRDVEEPKHRMMEEPWNENREDSPAENRQKHGPN